LFSISEYLLGENYLVAPVIEEGKTSRSIYLPKGRWRDGNNEANVYEGKTWIESYPAPLDTLPFFIREEEEE
jgi:myogenesis-regulating glycosidase